MDLISRQAAIDAIEKLILPQAKGETAAEEINRVAWRCAINCAEEMIGHLPSAERRGRWVPITERLPEKEGQYLITCVDDRGTPFVDASLYDPPTDWRGAIWDFPNVVAWMERPEPYKGKEEC